MKMTQLLLMLLLLSASALSLGVAPSKSEVFFEPLAEKEMVFRVINNENKEMDVALLAKGPLSEYITFERVNLHFSADEYEKMISYRFNLPSSMKPGPNTVDIIVVEVGKGDDSMLTASVGVTHKATVVVPYPDRYVEGIIYVSPARPNEKVDFTIGLANLGTKPVSGIAGRIVITGSDGSGVAELRTSETSLEAGAKGKVTASWMASVPPGSYHAEAVITYDNGKITVVDKDFDVGEPLVDISELRVGSFKLGTVAKFDIGLQSMWGQTITDAYAETEIRDASGYVVDSFKTSTSSIQPQSKTFLTSYWDTVDTQAGEFMITVKAHYLGRTVEKIFGLDVEDKKITVREPEFTGRVVSSGPRLPALDFNAPVIVLVVVLVFLLALVKIYLDYKVKVAPQAGDEEVSRLKEYVKSMLKEGYSKEAIRDAMQKKGWKKDQIDKVL